ncbi:hypothetical protein Nmel_004272 [Mimus melanotis]
MLYQSVKHIFVCPCFGDIRFPFSEKGWICNIFSNMQYLQQYFLHQSKVSSDFMREEL